MTETDWKAQERRRELRSRIAVAIFCLGMFSAVLAGLFWHEDGLDPARLLAVATVVGAVVAVAGLGGLIAFRPGEAQKRLAQSGGYRDRLQRDWVARINFLPVAMLGLTVIAMARADEWLSGEDPSLSGVFLAAAAVLNVLLIPVMIMGWDGGSRKQKRLLEDELTRTYRADAMIRAFWVLLVGVMGLYLVGLWNPRVTVVALPMVLWIAAATAAMRFAALHRRAEREMEDDG